MSQHKTNRLVLLQTGCTSYYATSSKMIDPALVGDHSKDEGAMDASTFTNRVRR